MDIQDIRTIDIQQIGAFLESKGEKKFRAKQIYEWLWKNPVNSFDEMSNLSKKTRELLKKNFTFTGLTLAKTAKSTDGTIKSAFQLYDGHYIETVLIPSMGRITVCISTQVGCALACKFCATGTLKLKRNLTAGEIFDQVAYARQQAKEQYDKELSNIVVMGMGEPLNNYEAVLKAIHHISSPDGLGMSPRRITLSTSGLANKIKQLADDAVNFNLAISLHTANDNKRSSIMPINKKYNLKELTEAIVYFHEKTGARITYEYLLLKDFNDGISDARELAEFCKSTPCKINLIEYNPTGDGLFAKSSKKNTERFIEYLEKRNILVQLRKSKGEDIDAACGQLANKIINKTKNSMNVNWKKLQNGSDIRGVALEGIAGEEVNLTTDIAQIIGRSFVYWLKEQAEGKDIEYIAVGTDSRLSGASLKNAFIKGITELGVSVYDCDMASTPAMFMTTVNKDHKIDAGVMLTASHLPFNRNGMKFFTEKGGLDKADITKILAFAAENKTATTTKAGVIKKLDFISLYSEIIVDNIRSKINDSDNYNTPLQGLKIIVDAGNGAGGFFADKVLAPLGADTSGSQFLNPDGRFPNHVPNPEDEEAINSICEAVKREKADLGIIFDTDVDRSAIVDSKGNPINRNELIALISAVILEEDPGSTIVTDSITSDGLGWFINDKLKGQHHRFKRGYKNVINEAIRLNDNGQTANIAIETSGHAALKENYFLDDGAYLVAKILIKMAQLRKQNIALTSLIEDLPRPHESKEFRFKITTEDFVAYGNQLIEDLKAFTEKTENWTAVPNNFEGIRVSCTNSNQNGWFLLRLSLHDPVIPVNIESNIEGGIAEILAPLKAFLSQYEHLELS